MRQPCRHDAVSSVQRRALKLLASSPFGCTEAIMLAHGLNADVIAGLVCGGLAAKEPGTVRASKRQIEVVWVMITDAGLRALDA